MPIENDNKIHEEDVQDIIGRAPIWVVNWGGIIIGCLVLLFSLGAWIVRYPEEITVPVLISAQPRSERISAHASGSICKVNVQNNEHVIKGQIIAIIDNTADAKDMKCLKDLVEGIDTSLNIKERLTQIVLPKNIKVGVVQSNYANLFQLLSEYQVFARGGYFSDSEVLKKKSNKSLSVDKIQGLLSQDDQISAIRQLSNCIRNQINKWEEQFVLRSPIDGKLLYINALKKGRHVYEEDPLFIVVPEQQHCNVYTHLPYYIAAKIKDEQSILIEFRELRGVTPGRKKARIENLKNLTIDSVYSSLLKFDEQSDFCDETFYSSLPLKGQANILFGEKNILQRIFSGSQSGK